MEKVKRKDCKWLKIKDSLFVYKLTLLVNKCFSAAAWGLLACIVVMGFMTAIANMRYSSAQGLLYLVLFVVAAGVMSIPQLLISRATNNSGKKESNEIINEASVLRGAYNIIYRIVGVILAIIPSIVTIVSYLVAKYVSNASGYYATDVLGRGAIGVLIAYMVLYFFPIIGYFVLGRKRDVLCLKLRGDYDTVKSEMEIGIREETEKLKDYANYREQMRRYKVDRKRVDNGVRPKTESEHNRDCARITWVKRISALAAAVAVVAVAIGIAAGIDPNYGAKAAKVQLGYNETQVIRAVGEKPHEEDGNTYHWYGKKARKIKKDMKKLDEKELNSEKDIEQAIKKAEQLDEQLDKLGDYKHLSVTFDDNGRVIEIKYDAKEKKESASEIKKIKSKKLSGSVDFNIENESGRVVYSVDRSSSSQTATATVEYEDGSYVCKAVYVSISDDKNQIAVWNTYWVSEPIETEYRVSSRSDYDETMTISFYSGY